MPDANELMTLRDGSQIPGVAVGPVLLTLRELMERRGIAGIIACYELRELCRNPRHQLFGSSGDMLKDYGLLDINGCPHEIVRDVVVNAVVGDELEMTLQSPLGVRNYGQEP